MAFQNSNGVDASRSTFNDVRDQINIGRDHIIFNFSDLSSESISSSSGVHSAPATTLFSRRRRRRSVDYSSDDSERDSGPTETKPIGRCEAIRRQRIEDNQRKRDELRGSYRKLKDELPPSDHFKSNKVTLLLRAITYIRQLKVALEQSKASLAQSEAETTRLRNVNEALILGSWDNLRSP